MTPSEPKMVECEGCGAQYNASNPAEVQEHANCTSPEHIEQA